MLAWCRQTHTGKKDDDHLMQQNDDGSSVALRISASPSPSPSPSPPPLSSSLSSLPLPSCLHRLVTFASGNCSNGSSDHDVDSFENKKSERPLITEAQTNKFTLRRVDLTPAYLHNPHILTGYRVYFTQRLALLSLFRWHNETLNVWTHFLPWIIFMLRYGAWMMKMMTGNEANDSLVDGVVDTSSTSIPTEWVDYLMFSIFYLSLILCMFWSSIYHLFGCCTYDLHQCLYRCDIGGILVLIWGSYIPALYYAFRCRAELQWIYCTIITLLVVILAINFNLPHCQQRRFHSLRVGSLVLTIAFAILPTFHWIGWVHEKDYPQVPLETFITPLAGMLGSYMIGFIFYSQHIPERWSRNGRFDFIGQSHNWWHLWIVIAATIWESELQSMWKQRGMANCGGI